MCLVAVVLWWCMLILFGGVIQVVVGCIEGDVLACVFFFFKQKTAYEM